MCIPLQHIYIPNLIVCEDHLLWTLIYFKANLTADITLRSQCPDGFRGPSNLLSNGYRGFFPGVKWPGREAYHLPPMPRLRMRGDIPPLLQYVFMALCVI